MASSYRGTMVIAALVGGASVVLGLSASYYGDVTPGSAIVVVVIGFYLLTGPLAAVVGVQRR